MLCIVMPLCIGGITNYRAIKKGGLLASLELKWGKNTIPIWGVVLPDLWKITWKITY